MIWCAEFVDGEGRLVVVYNGLNTIKYGPFISFLSYHYSLWEFKVIVITSLIPRKVKNLIFLLF